MAAAVWWTHDENDAQQERAEVEERRRGEAAAEKERERDEEADEGEGEFPWLEAKQRRDSSGRSVTHPLYDPSTVYVPQEALRMMTPFEKQV